MLWGDDGKPQGPVEAKRTHRDARAGKQQAKLYADCFEREFGWRPVEREELAAYGTHGAVPTLRLP
ncbi:MAG: hypothetical protein ACT4PV_05890 [Planctomycetaceae bacterium]